MNSLVETLGFLIEIESKITPEIPIIFVKINRFNLQSIFFAVKHDAHH